MNEKNVGKIKTMPTKQVLNYHPCLIRGRTTEVEAPNERWTEIGWTYRVTRNGEMIVLCVLYNLDKVDSRASFNLNHHDGVISKFRFQDNNSFDEDDAYSINSAIDFFRKSNDAFYYVRNLVKYFKAINDVEYAKATTELVDHQFSDEDLIITGKNITPANNGGVDSIYNPTSEVHTKPSVPSMSCKRNYKMSSWQIHGHYRHYKNGKTVYIKPTIGYRRKELIV